MELRRRDPHYIGEVLKRLREERKWSQRELARRANLTSGAVTLLEKNAREPSASVLLALSRALGVSVAVFFPSDPS